MTSLFSLTPAPVNHLLAQDAWARERLAAHAGKIARLDAGLLALDWQVTADGMFKAAESGATPHVVLRVKLADVPLILQNRERAVSYVRIEGDADFANAISQLSESLKWEAEEDLGRVVGDVAAHRIVSTAKSALSGARARGQALQENIAEYFLEENPMLLRPHAVADFGREVGKLRDDIERLEKRVRKLDR
ncbi:SCP2 sterol-binding domain-containing protein [Janthinobacterium sp. 17J80-10]|uniref:ubiquinone biosynthesis accessory factor UbiJ n=1 Tax=Janthinobacterium sp. 17J80-10 TaxID=2497863 RepID=UPI001005A61F|nr:SCP2 sterol-binding domain-containing protein [Janthinobacterium sp. 17J80-10]QAU33399.1 sterol-binding protein [Janthinobacterium sp. 17J80-10]